MKEFCDNLEKTLKNQLEITKKLIELSDSKTEALKDNDIAQIMSITNNEEIFARQIIEFEKQRDIIIKEYEKRENVKINNISELIEKLSSIRATDFILLSEDLKYNLDILKQKNNVNDEIMSFLLEQIEIANNIIQGDRVPNTYENTKFNKKYSTNTHISYFDRKY